MCYFHGDPHFVTFDGAKLDMPKPESFWIVHSSTVQIQGMANGRGLTYGVAVVYDDHSAVIWSTHGSKDYKSFCDGKPCLQENDQTFHIPGVMSVKRGTHSREGKRLMFTDAELNELAADHKFF